MISVTGLNTASVSILKNRGLSEQQVSHFSELLEQAHKQQDNNVSAKKILANMTVDDLSLIQKATSLAERIKVDSLSNEGAINLLSQPDKANMVDLNNDGIVEVGTGKLITFPPVNAPAHIKEAWGKSTSQLNEEDKLLLELKMHTSTYGFQIEGNPTIETLSPAEQWSPENIKNWLAKGRSGIDFQVQHSGWTHQLQVQKDFYNRFESELGLS
jgi:hypothetical protein